MIFQIVKMAICLIGFSVLIKPCAKLLNNNRENDLKFAEFLKANSDKETVEIIGSVRIGGNSKWMMPRKKFAPYLKKRFNETGKREYLEWLDCYDKYAVKASIFEVCCFLFGVGFLSACVELVKILT